MAVLVEAISIIVRRLDIDTKYPDGWDGYVSDCPNATLCADQHLARVGFMAPADARLFVERLSDKGFVTEPPESREIAVVDHVSGPLQAAGWLEVGGVTYRGHEVCACRLVGDDSGVLITPDGWSWGASLYGAGHWQPESAVDSRWRFVRHEDGVDVFLDPDTGKERYVGRTGLSKLVDDPASRKRRDLN